MHFDAIFRPEPILLLLLLKYYEVRIFVFRELHLSIHFKVPLHFLENANITRSQFSINVHFDSIPRRVNDENPWRRHCIWFVFHLGCRLTSLVKGKTSVFHGITPSKHSTEISYLSRLCCQLTHVSSPQINVVWLFPLVYAKAKRNPGKQKIFFEAFLFLAKYLACGWNSSTKFETNDTRHCEEGKND